MKLSQIHLENIEHLSPVIQEAIIKEAPHTRMTGPIPAELQFLADPIAMIDFGFENLSVTGDEKKTLGRAFLGMGVHVPGTQLRLRNIRPFVTVVEPITGEEPTLPIHWKRVVYVVKPGDYFTWIGKDVRPDQTGPVDLRLFEDVGDGYIPLPNN